MIVLNSCTSSCDDSIQVLFEGSCYEIVYILDIIQNLAFAWENAGLELLQPVYESPILRVSIWVSHFKLRWINQNQVCARWFYGFMIFVWQDFWNYKQLRNLTWKLLLIQHQNNVSKWNDPISVSN